MNDRPILRPVDQPKPQQGRLSAYRFTPFDKSLLTKLRRVLAKEVWGDGAGEDDGVTETHVIRVAIRRLAHEKGVK